MINRDFEYDVLEVIQKRWSPRAFDSAKEVSEEDLMAIIEAARYAPSCFNEQPWRYLIARKGSEAFENVVTALTGANKEWAPQAPILMVLLSKKTFSQNDKDNRWHLFDAGTAWGFLSLEAQKRGMITHGMGGFSVAKIKEAFQISDEFSIIALVACGYKGKKEDLSETLQAKEHPSPRKSAKEVLL